MYNEGGRERQRVCSNCEYNIQYLHVLRSLQVVPVVSNWIDCPSPQTPIQDKMIDK